MRYPQSVFSKRLCGTSSKAFFINQGRLYPHLHLNLGFQFILPLAQEVEWNMIFQLQIHAGLLKTGYFLPCALLVYLCLIS